ncbi:MAG: hypothetical protein HN341_09110 [Verrucomicrobia bacterium]|nr:hypothetical protein [Verrucomicrobiota bacterium]
MTRGFSKLAVKGIASLFLTLFLLEAVTRLTGVTPPLPKLYRDEIYRPHPILPFHLRPSIQLTAASGTGEFTQTTVHNSVGYRDIEHTPEKPAGTLRILGVGDSFAYGAGAEFHETYLAVLEQLLNSNPTRSNPVEIIKAGIGGCTPLTERLLVECEGLAYDPDLILVGFNETDIFEIHIDIEEVRLYEGFLKNAQAKRLGYTGTWLVLNSHFARLVHSKVSRHAAKKRQREFDTSPKLVEAAWERIGQELGRIGQLAATNGAKAVVCYIPLSLEECELSRDELLRQCSPYGIPVIDTSPYLLAAQQEGRVYWKRDGHCTPRGYRAVAEAIYDTLKQKGGHLYP